MRIAVGRGRSPAHAASWPDQIGSSRSGGAPWPMYRAGMRSLMLITIIRYSTLFRPSVGRLGPERPVDRVRALLDEESVDGGEGLRAEEAAVGRQRGRVGRLDRRHRAEPRLEGA